MKLPVYSQSLYNFDQNKSFDMNTLLDGQI